MARPIKLVELESQGGRLGILQENVLFEALSNFSIQAKGKIRLPHNGIVFDGHFPDEKAPYDHQQFFMPFADTKKRERFINAMADQTKTTPWLHRKANPLWEAFIQNQIQAVAQTKFHMSKITGFQESLFKAEDPDSVQFCLGPSTKQYLNSKGLVETNPQYILFPYEKTTKLGAQEIKVPQLKWDIDGGKAAFRTLFPKLKYETLPDEIANFKRWQFLFSIAYSCSANYAPIIRAKYTQGQFPTKILVATDKGTGKSWCMSKCLWVGSDPEFKMCARTSEMFIKHRLGDSTFIWGIDDSTSRAHEEELVVAVYEVNAYGTIAKGIVPPRGTLIITTNRTDRSERHSDRCVFTPFDGIIKWGEEEAAETTEKETNLTPNPKDWVFSLAWYLWHPLYQQRMTSWFKRIKESCPWMKDRTIRNYTTEFVWMELLRDEFGDDLEELKMTTDSLELYLENQLFPALKELHKPAEEVKIVLDRFLQKFYTKYLQHWTKSEVGLNNQNILFSTTDKILFLFYFSASKSAGWSSPNRFLAKLDKWFCALHSGQMPLRFQRLVEYLDQAFPC